MEIVLMLVLPWIACGVATAGITYAYFDAEFPILRGPGRHRELLGMAAMFGVAGPIGLIVSLLSSGFAHHGWRLSGAEQRKK